MRISKSDQNIELIGRQYDNEVNFQTIDINNDIGMEIKSHSNLTPRKKVRDNIDIQKNDTKKKRNVFDNFFEKILLCIMFIVYYIAIGYIGYAGFMLFAYFFKDKMNEDTLLMLTNECNNPISLCFFMQTSILTIFIVIFYSVYFWCKS
tara:strand:+ start:747 stop:1193 length:447 start_codon:yes stop_codon:yes gene_type:complete